MKKNVIVTGGAGFIGSNLCKVLAQRNFYPITVDDLSTGFRGLVKYGDFVEADCGDYTKMCEVFNKYKPLAIFHIAGSKSVEESGKNPHKYYENNVAKTNQLLKAAADSGVKYFIFSSTAVIFDTSGLISEDAPKNPLNTYGMSKLMVEQMLDSYDKSHGIKHSALRYFNVTGADPESEVGEITKNPANIFPILNEVVSGKRAEFTIFGDDYDTFDGTCIRDYIHVCDLADAHILALEKLIETNKSFKMNLGNGAGFSVHQVVEVFKKITGINFKVLLGKRRQGDPASLIANNKFAGEYLRWFPKYTSLEDQALHAWKWYQKSKKYEQ
ncbi:MAG: UDP-glucose 4-epimerase GalE [Proteobacteria bacterium]|nr:UDP-glucose 4-epimerase GalE [Pseudomonadota bacterium]